MFTTTGPRGLGIKLASDDENSRADNARQDICILYAEGYNGHV